MQIVVPLVYTVRGIPKNGRIPRDIHVVELIDWDIGEVSSTDAPEAILIQVENYDPRTARRDNIVLREFKGALLRPAGTSEYNWTCPLKRHELPVWKNGMISSNYIVGFLGLMPFPPHGPMFQAAYGMMLNGGKEKTNFDQAIRFGEIISSDRQTALEKTRERMADFMLVDDVLWEVTDEPSWSVSVEHGQAYARLAYSEFPQKEDHLYVPLGDADLLQAVADCMGGELIASGRVEQVSDTVALSSGPGMMIERAARFILDDTAAALGDYPSALMSIWMDVREAIGGPVDDGAFDLRAKVASLIDCLDRAGMPSSQRALRELAFIDRVYETSTVNYTPPTTPAAR